MTSTLHAALGTDKEGLEGRVVLVEEHQRSNANFVLSALMVQQLQRHSAVCLLALHNAFSHYCNVISKLGNHNLVQLQEKGQVDVVELLWELRASLDASITGVEGDCLGLCSGDSERIAKNLFLTLRDKVQALLSARDTVCIIIDDLSDLLALGITLRDVLAFFQYCRTLLRTYKGVSLVVLCHVLEDDEELCVLAAAVAHVADMVISVGGLATGSSADVSGSLRVVHRSAGNVPDRKWNQQDFYHFKVQDRSVKLFAPGTHPTHT